MPTFFSGLKSHITIPGKSVAPLQMCLGITAGAAELSSAAQGSSDSLILLMRDELCPLM